MADNLLEKASILLTPTAYNDGSMLSVKPNENLYGSEIVINGGFDTDSNWGKGANWTISNGKANSDGSSNGQILQSNVFEANKTYQVTFTVTKVSGSGLTARAYYGSYETILSITESGTYTTKFTPNTSTNGTLYFISSGSFVGSIDNVSVKEDLTGDFDFTRGSAATRVNAQGLVENVQIISSELVSNGNFSQEGSELVTNGDFATDSDWTKVSNTTISGGKANAVSNANGFFIIQASTLDVNKTYKLTFDLTDYTSGTLQFVTADGDVSFSNTLGTKELTFTPPSNNILFKTGNAPATFSIDNVSVKEVGQDWTFGTGFSVDQANSRAEATDAPFGSQLIDSTTLVASKKYKISFDITNYVKGIVRIAVGNVFSDEVSSNGNFTFILTTANTNAFKVQARGGGSGTTLSVSNVSVKEITDDTNIPRIDYTDGCGSWLLEPQSTNLITYSEDFSNAYWTKQNSATITSNSITSPNGAIDADLLNCPTNGRILASTSVTSGVKYTFSIFIKKGTSSLFGVDLYDGGSNLLIYNFDTNVVSGSITDNSIEDYGNGWHRLSGAITTASTTLSCFIYGNGGYSENEANTYIWGAQLEEQSYATSYIPTNGSIATRLADVANNSGNSSLINSTEGVLYAEIAALTDSDANRAISLFEDNNNTISIFYITATNTIRALILTNGGTKVLIEFVLNDATDFNKIAFKYKENDCALWVNGIEVGTDATATIPTALNSLNFDYVSNPFYGKVKALAVYKEALTDAELQSLTTI